MAEPDVHGQIIDVLSRLAAQYPSEMVIDQTQDIPRIAFNLKLALTRVGEPLGGMEVCDLGGGLGLFSVGCAALGVKRTVLVDDFKDTADHSRVDAVLDLHRRYGVEVFSRDVVARGISDLPGTFDVISTFDSMEHWHHSPKRLFQEAGAKLKPGGTFVLGVPNCVNLRKRLTVPLGRGKWSGMQEWYEAPVFRGHVREPDVEDLRYIARSMGLSAVKCYGRNWFGYESPSRLIRTANRVLDGLLRLRPALCSNIYVVGRAA